MKQPGFVRVNFPFQAVGSVECTAVEKSRVGMGLAETEPPHVGIQVDRQLVAHCEFVPFVVQCSFEQAVVGGMLVGTK